ncbi:hypothetical protein BO82DRAFT_169746 [Aspergillus uvarum CBS 121591]|uniref:Uncharacterized protein n=1 Tax=Aspergillus uvarum CBS 121591 TaxID=1448315 RepID=A0A319BZ34_9EURO|nr:hypothetical protein BO82DRAFT_169746 [Aspergillus uvarum CBS 121591]PYH78024.1 hypothetical protein BO82DRAFT_169746 [Aspergillus uvarum CBS 121591]
MNLSLRRLVCFHDRWPNQALAAPRLLEHITIWSYPVHIFLDFSFGNCVWLNPFSVLVPRFLSISMVHSCGSISTRTVSRTREQHPLAYGLLTFCCWLLSRRDVGGVTNRGGGAESCGGACLLFYHL